MQGVCEGVENAYVPFNNCEVAQWEIEIKALLGDSCSSDSDQLYCSCALKTALLYLHNKFTVHRGYLDTLEGAYRFVPKNQQSWGWRPLIVTPFLQVGLLILLRLSSIPLHDHPNAWGVQQVISGKVRIRNYQFVSDTDQQQTLVDLEEVSDSLLVKGGHSTFSPRVRNLHEFESMSHHCVLLSMMINPYRQEDGYWYFQLAMTLSGSRGLYNRIKKDRLLSLSRMWSCSNRTGFYGIQGRG